MEKKRANLVSEQLQPLAQKDFVDYLKKGIRNAWHNIFLMTGNLNEEVRPEYITTAAICFSLAENAGFMNNGRGLIVKAEHGVDKLFKMAEIAIGKDRINIKNMDIRKGRVDISLSQEINGWCVPCAVIENKSYVRLLKKDFGEVELYGSDWGKVAEDIRRNLAIIHSEAGEAVTNTAATFYVSNSFLVLKKDVDNFINNLNVEVMKSVKNSFPELAYSKKNSLSVEVFEVEGNYYHSQEDAEKVNDEDGCPEYVSSGNWFLAGVIIALSKTINK